MVARTLFLSTLFLSTLFRSAPCEAAPAWWAPSRWELRIGYGYQYKNTKARPNNYQIHFLLPSVVIPFTKAVGPSWCRGRFTWNPELLLAFMTHPNNRPIVGMIPLQVRYELEPIAGRWSPYAGLGAGVLHANVNRRETDSDLNFSVSGALGVRYRVNPQTSAILEYRHLHISNAGLDEFNSGLNTHTFFAGISITF